MLFFSPSITKSITSERNVQETSITQGADITSERNVKGIHHESERNLQGLNISSYMSAVSGSNRHSHKTEQHNVNVQTTQYIAVCKIPKTNITSNCLTVQVNVQMYRGKTLQVRVAVCKITQMEITSNCS